ncbi:MAG: acyl-CoA dehydrogenase family protein [Legionellales bacterium]|jgi:glutaryl-CoA dehydrogenase
MKDFLLLDEQLSVTERQIRDNVREFVAEHALPKMAKAFEDAVFPEELTAQMAQLGLFGMTLPTEYGGANANYVSYGLACQELEYGDSSLRSFVSVQSSLVMFPIFHYGSTDQKKYFLPKLASAQFIGCFGLTEPDSGSDPASMQTTAQPVQDGYILNGNKMWITNGDIADIAIVWAKTPDGIRGFIVEKNSPGFIQKTVKHKMSLRASHTGELILNDCFVPQSHYLAGTQTGLSAALKCLTQARYGIAWGANGAAQACYDTALEYCQLRKQFNQPLASFQLVQKDLVDMLNEIVKAQTLNLHLGRLMDKQQAHFAMISLAKMNACQNALNIARSARNLLGANGISLEYPVIRHMNNLESVFTYEGTDNIHHLIVGRHITGL